jgi:hypothetical protein
MSSQRSPEPRATEPPHRRTSSPNSGHELSHGLPLALLYPFRGRPYHRLVGIPADRATPPLVEPIARHLFLLGADLQTRGMVVNLEKVLGTSVKN